MVKKEKKQANKKTKKNEEEESSAESDVRYWYPKIIQTISVPKKE